jgi:hypothetical protein
MKDISCKVTESGKVAVSNEFLTSPNKVYDMDADYTIKENETEWIITGGSLYGTGVFSKEDYTRQQAFNMYIEANEEDDMDADYTIKENETEWIITGGSSYGIGVFSKKDYTQQQAFNMYIEANEEDGNY